jgi:LuxR family maltose regulon positive regulatory protein
MAVPGTQHSMDVTAVEELIAATRFKIPELPTSYVHRPQLLEVLAQAKSMPLVLVSAPAGTGKTSLVAEWVTNSGDGTTGWISFEDGDAKFWCLVLECLDRLGLSAPVQSQETAADTSLGKPGLMALAGVIVGAPGRLSIVIDGYEMMSLELAREVDFLLQHTLGKLRLIFVGRVDPVLPLYRYRLTDTLLEIRAADLAFTDEEAAQLMRLSGVTLSRTVVHDLNERVKGWAAGLRFAARALVTQEDPERSAATVVAQTGDINEYLVGEVLNAQLPEVRRFLLDTCVIDTLFPELVEELAGSRAVRTLGELARLNAFIEPVPDRPGSYRYYPFFRDLLRAQLAYESPQRMVELHRRAARWFEREGVPDLAIGHLSTIGAWDEVATLIVNGLMVPRLLLEDRGGTLGKVGLRLPDDLDQSASCVVRAAVALATGDRAACAEELARARRAEPAPAVRDEALLVGTAVIDAVRASLADDAESAIVLAKEAEQALSRPNPRRVTGSDLYALVQFSKGVALLRRGEFAPAKKALAYAAGHDRARSYASFRADCLGYVAVIEVLEGHLSRARRAAEQSVALAANSCAWLADRSPTAHVALACAAFEQYDLKAAREHIGAAMAFRAIHGDPVSRGLAEGVIAGLERARGQLRPALARLEGAAATLTSTDPMLADHLRVEAAKLSVASGRAELALGALAGIEERDEPEAAVIAAAAYAEQGKQAAVQDCLARARDGEPPLPARVTGLLVEAMQESLHRSPARAHVALERSLRLAAPEGLRRPFREAGPTVRRLLMADSRLLIENRWLSQTHRSAALTDRANRQEPGGRGNGAGVVEQLTAKEFEVLGHLQELLTTEEIAEKMSVSVNTVRTHVRSILRKLGVDRRNTAVRKARELGMIKG